MSGLWSRLRNQFQSLNLRERLLVGAAVGILGTFLLLVLVVNPILKASTQAKARAEAASEELAAVTHLRRQYDQVSGRVTQVEERIASGSGGEIFTTLERLARASSVKLDSMEPRTSSPNEEYRETKVQVGMKKVTLAQLVKYLHSIESEEELLSIKSLRVRVRADTPEFLDVNFSVSSFERI